ncbi:hypothetical protein GBA52_018813 [Prunus armeniaca]|nr:hypothetical protein GBA52_018813 [Prunus armeniaca]
MDKAVITQQKPSTNQFTTMVKTLVPCEANPNFNSVLLSTSGAPITLHHLFKKTQFEFFKSDLIRVILSVII